MSNQYLGGVISTTQEAAYGLKTDLKRSFKAGRGHSGIARPVLLRMPLSEFYGVFLAAVRASRYECTEKPRT